MGRINVTPYQNNNSYNEGYKKWYFRTAPFNTLTVDDLANHIALDSKVERAKVSEISRAVLKQIEELLCNGHGIRIPHLGLLRLGVSSKGSDTVSGFNAARHITDLHIVLIPCREVKDEIRKVKFFKVVPPDLKDVPVEPEEENPSGEP